MHSLLFYLLGNHFSCLLLVNVLGIKVVALSSSLFSLFIIAPFIVLSVAGAHELAIQSPNTYHTAQR